MAGISYWMGTRGIQDSRYWISEPTNYEECVTAGGIVVTSNPEECSFRGKSFVNTSPAPVQPPTSLTPPTSTVPAGWKMYRNEEYGFEFGYSDTTMVRNLYRFSSANPDLVAEVSLYKLPEGQDRDGVLSVYNKNLQNLLAIC